jgi:[acyl-carrier-protein] S-malonyltransferase
MEPARERLARAIATTPVAAPRCPLVSNVHATATTDPDEIRTNLIAQLTAPVRWTQSMHTILGLGATEIIEVGPGTVLQGLFKKVDRGLAVSSAALAEPA